MKRTIVLGLAGLGILANAATACEPAAAQLLSELAGCVPCGPADASPAASPVAEAPAVAAGGNGIIADVDIENFAFDPSPLIIPLNAAVKWTNRDLFGHTSTSSAIPPVWDSGALGMNQSFTHTFVGLGVFPYECIIHFGMNGTLTVRAPGDANNDLTVDISDFATLAGNFNQPGTYDQGNFNLDTLVDIGDFAILAGNFNEIFSGNLPRGTNVPEPSAACIALLPIAVARRRRG